MTTLVEHDNLTVGNYLVTVMDDSGCEQDTLIEITGPDLLTLTVSASSLPLCFGASTGTATATSSGGTGPYTFAWVNNSTGLALTPGQITTLGSQSIAIGLADGSYDVTLTDNNNCATLPPTQSVTITAPSQILPNILYTSVSCNGGSDGEAELTPTGGTAPYTYLWSGIIPPAPTNLNSSSGLNGTTAYFVDITDGNGCNIIVAINVPEPAPLSALLSTTNVSCFGGNTGSASVAISGGTQFIAPLPPYNYSFLENGTTIIPAISLSAGNYSYLIEDANGCNSTIPVTITETPEVLTNLVVTNISCNNTFGSATVSPSGGTGIPYNVVWWDGTFGNTHLNIIAGLAYNVTVTNGGCSVTTPFSISEPPALTVLTSSTSATCFGDTDGSAQAIAGGGTGLGTYTYEWFSDPAATTALLPAQITPIAVGLAAGIYAVTVTDNDGCKETEVVSITAPAQILPNISVTSVSCYGGSNGAAELMPTGGTPFTASGVAHYIYSWSGVISTNSISNQAVGTYDVLITDSIGCDTHLFFNITQPNDISINFTSIDYNGYDVSCNGLFDAEITVTANGGISPYLYSLDGGNVFPYTILNTFSNLTIPLGGIGAGLFDVYIKDANDCLKNSSMIVTQPQIIDPNINLTGSLTCSSGSNGQLASTPSGGVTTFSSPYTYLWSDGTTGQFMSNLAMGTHSVIVTDANGCDESEDYVLAPLFTVILTFDSTDVSCFGLADGTATVTASGGTPVPAYTYLWSDGQTTSTATGLLPGSYTCTVTDINGCTASGSVTVNQSPTSLTLNTPLISNNSCFGGSNGSAIVYPTGGSQLFGSTYNFLWSDGQITQNATGLSAGIYTCTVTDALGCLVVDSIIITDPTEISIVLTATDITCNGFNNGTATANASGGTPFTLGAPYTYSWNTTPVQTTQTADSLSAGTYTCTITDANGCTGLTSSFTIVNPSVITATTSQTNITCNNANNGTATVVNPSGGTPFSVLNPYTYSWNTTPVQTTQTATGLSAGSYNCTITDANGCTFTTLSVIITEPAAALTVTTSETNTTCYGYSDGVATVTSSGGTFPYTYSWNTIPVQTTQTADSLSAGTYTCTITDANGCTFTTPSVTITEPDEIQILSLESCYGSLLVEVINANGNYNIFWYNEEVEIVLPEGPLEPGLYTASVFDLYCSIIDSFTINDPFNYTIADASCQLEADGSIEIYNINGGNSIASYSVFVNDEIVSNNVLNEILIDSLLATDYQILIINNNDGCTIVDSLLAIGYIGGYDCIDVPIVVSPNGDGTNDTWKPIYDIDTDIEVIILNRWGITEFYYSGNSLVFEWNGMRTDKNSLPSTDYYYIIKFNNTNYPDKTGVITLIR
jgi:gliding motility-associated-like protein